MRRGGFPGRAVPTESCSWPRSRLSTAATAAHPLWYQWALGRASRQALFFSNKPAADISCSIQGRALLTTRSNRDWDQRAREYEHIHKHNWAVPGVWGKQALQACFDYSCEQQPPETERAEAALCTQHPVVPQFSIQGLWTTVRGCRWPRQAAPPGWPPSLSWLRHPRAHSKAPPHSAPHQPRPPCAAKNSHQDRRNREHKLNKPSNFLKNYLLLIRLTEAVML